MIHDRKTAVLIGDSEKNLTEMVEIARDFAGRGFLTIIPWRRPESGSELLKSFNSYEEFDQLESACKAADLLVMVNLNGMTDQMEYIASKFSNTDVVWLIPAEDRNAD